MAPSDILLDDDDILKEVRNKGNSNLWDCILELLVLESFYQGFVCL